jgi:hypothetical protein
MNKELLQKVAEFNNLALVKISSLEEEVAELKKQAEAKQVDQDKLDNAVKIAADALYDSDFITDRFAYKDFVKKASSNPSYLAKALSQVCASKDVLGCGVPSSATVKSADANDFDPIYNRAFLGGPNGSSKVGFADLLED